ncbi:Interferon regulatory factor 2-binding protein-like A [Eumeta japonica]|uniref:Interferon regulatory factor 2-binding protein-like A n=1 Tax=Eumeta variegata TaxID=151549 RepID=A0A4C1XL31_EUMVA|nr:Interferon regulatory factor 2-binding protein-like A [Eumeta japonica]
MSQAGYGGGAPLTNGSAGSPLGRAAGSPPVSAGGAAAGGAGAGPSPMAALMSVADTLPPGSPRSAGGSPPQPPPQRSASRSSQHSPNSSGSSGGRRSSGSRHVSSTTSVSSTEAGEAGEAPPSTAPLLKCTLCQERLEDTHFVQCPSQIHHKFCFPCSRDSIKRQQGTERSFNMFICNGLKRDVLNIAGVLSERRKMSAGELDGAVGVHAGRDRHDPGRGVQAEEGARDLGQRAAAAHSTLPLVPLAVSGRRGAALAGDARPGPDAPRTGRRARLQERTRFCI